MVSNMDKTGDRPWTPACGEGSKKADQLPKTAGVYEWRVPHAFLPDLKVVFTAHMRMRGGCGDDFLFPAFDHWNGWQATIPTGVEWREAESPQTIKAYDYGSLGIEGHEISACPFCGTTPRLEAHETGGGRGIVVGGKPHRYDSWSLRCCSWTGRPSMRDPRDVIAAREAALAKHRR
jgi:hypothetical protein